MSAADVSPGTDPTAIIKGSVRYKAFYSDTTREIYLGKQDLGVGSNRVEVDAVWQSSNHVIFTYNPATGKETTTVQAGSNTYNLEYPAAGTYDQGILNYMQLHVVNRATGTTVDFNNVTLNGESLGNFTGVGWSSWKVTGGNLTNGFTIEGDIVLSGTQPGGETNKVEVNVGYVPLTITTSSLPDGWVGIAYNQTLAATGGLTPYTWSITSGSLPSGLSLISSTGVISGTPTATGTSNFIVQVMDAYSSTATKNFSITIRSNSARIWPSLIYHSGIQEAYDDSALSDGDTMQCQALVLNENVLCSDNVSFTLKGGYDANFTSNLGYTTIKGTIIGLPTLIISNGTVVVENIIIQ